MVKKDSHKNVKNKNILIVIGIVIILMLGYLIFKEDISWYSNRIEILRRVNIYNIPDVAVKCYDFVTNKNEDSVPSQDCTSEYNKWLPKTEEWKNLIKRRKDINCGDFYDNKDAKYFYHYISGELSADFYRYNTTPTPRSFSWRSTGDLHCTYDPYKLDTNNDCNACENYQ